MIVEGGEYRSVLKESPSTMPDQRTPCPMCGSLVRHIEVRLESTVRVTSDLAVKGRRNGERKPFVEQKVGNDVHRATGTWRNRRMVVDRDNDRYLKVVTDPKTGEEFYGG